MYVDCRMRDSEIAHEVLYAKNIVSNNLNNCWRLMCWFVWNVERSWISFKEWQVNLKCSLLRTVCKNSKQLSRTCLSLSSRECQNCSVFSICLEIDQTQCSNLLTRRYWLGGRACSHFLGPWHGQLSPQGFKSVNPVCTCIGQVWRITVDPPNNWPIRASSTLLYWEVSFIPRFWFYPPWHPILTVQKYAWYKEYAWIQLVHV